MKVFELKALLDKCDELVDVYYLVEDDDSITSYEINDVKEYADALARMVVLSALPIEEVR